MPPRGHAEKVSQSVVVRSAPYREYLHLIRIGEGWQIANALWLPQ